MSTTYGTASAITIPSDGDTTDAADVNTPLAAVWDQHDVLADTAALTAILVPTHGLIRYVRGYGHYVFVTSGTYSASTAVSPWILASGDGTAGRWVLDLTADANKTTRRSRNCNTNLFVAKADAAKSENVIGIDGGNFDFNDATVFLYSTSIRFTAADNAAALGRHVYFPLNEFLINGATLTGARVLLQPVAAHANVPAMMPAMSIVRYDPTNQTQVGLRAAGMTPDPSASGAIYSAQHTIEVVTDQNQTIELGSIKGYQYWAVVCNEGHTNAVAELQLFGIEIDMTTNGYL